MARSRVEADCATGIAGGWSSSRTGDKGDEDIGGGSGRKSRCMLSAGRALCGEREGALEGEWVVTLRERGDPGGVKSRPFTAACLAGERDVAGLASERLRPCRTFAVLYSLFGKLAGLRSPELFDRTSDTVASFTLRSEASGLLPPPDPLPVLRRGSSRDTDGDRCGDRYGVDDDSSSSMSTALPSRRISRSSGDGSPRLVRIFIARLRGETGGEGPSVSLVWAMEGMTRRDSLRYVAINTVLRSIQ
ncbi:hypothetical protein EI94DRAFT_1164282 [Lactarius quietus]|nr:hypothetical protein EI94DRAFT_1164282 [Lactarius quietus]